MKPHTTTFAPSEARFLRAALLILGIAAAILLSGCGPIRLLASTNIPTPLVMKLPITVALFVPKEFSEHVHKEERWSTDWNIDLGKAQTEGMTRLLGAMFAHVVSVDSVAAGAQVPDVRAILEPSIEEYAFVTPRDAGSPFFAVSIKYRMNVYAPDGKLADSWGFTGYGTSPSQGVSSAPPLSQATALAMRDAGAKLAVEFREQPVLRSLLPDVPSADAPAEASAPVTPPATEPAPEAAAPSVPAPEAPPSQPAQKVVPPPELEAFAKQFTPS